MSVSLNTSNEVIEVLLGERAKNLETCLNADVISYIGGIMFSVEAHVRKAVEGIDKKRTAISFLLESPGGYVEPVQRIADILRHHYQTVSFIIPDHAMSAGTVLVMSGDHIWMDYYAILGPIDPQVQASDGKFVSAIGYLKKYDELIEKSKAGQLTTAEMAFMINKFDPAVLFRYEQEKALSISLLVEWLAKYKFKNWTLTETRRLPVNDQMRRERADEIGNKLGDPDRWHSHGIGIPLKTLRDELNLKIDDFGQNTDMNDRVQEYFTLLKDYQFRQGSQLVIHTRNGYLGF